jgi:hypothetical protein
VDAQQCERPFQLGVSAETKVPWLRPAKVTSSSLRDRSFYATRTVPTGNLLLSILDLYGEHREYFGDSTGRLEELYG